MPPLAPHRLGEWAGYRTGCLKVRERGLPCNAKVYVVHGALCTDTIQPLSASDPKHARLKYSNQSLCRRVRERKQLWNANLYMVHF